LLLGVPLLKMLLGVPIQTMLASDELVGIVAHMLRHIIILFLLHGPSLLLRGLLSMD